MHFTLCTSLYAIHTMQFTLCNSLYAIHSMHFTLCTSLYALDFYALHSMRLTLCTSLYALHSMHFTLCTSLYALHSMHFTPCSSRYALHSMYFTLCCWVRGLRTEEPFAMLSGKRKANVWIPLVASGTSSRLQTLRTSHIPQDLQTPEPEADVLSGSPAWNDHGL